ncbi:MAG: TetR/AcrR family transcriptional regulator [Anaerolineae bacterium]|jgi:AcrR family transcriptional regulator|nr:TetR/AcrR family transcriptional regulator [Anaerolineae bacterium]MBT7189640.1 TetR/AcrR family transcriptional regulator [Anaerolineae bacterium]MBT7991832.1 TetR/AcrR family transcriptional regulator [Anaerolineae bacterium]
MARKKKRDWFIASTHILDKTGHNGLTIDALTTELSVTKGSFYHHFKNYQEFKVALLYFFEEEGTLDIIIQTEEEENPRKKLRRLMNIVVKEVERYPPKVEVAMRIWALEDKDAHNLMARVDKRRIDYVESLCQEIVTDQTQAHLMAEMMYTILVGSEHTTPPLSQTRLRVLFDEFTRLYQI